MLIALPFIAFTLVFIDLVGLQQTQKQGHIGWRVAILQAALLAGVWIVLQSELLGLFRVLSPAWVAGWWGFALLISAWFGWRKGLLRTGWRSLLRSLRSLDWIEVSFSVFLGVILFLLLVVAVLSPPNNTDSLLYHLSRVVHWAENRSLAHYVAAFQPQLVNPIGAELIILNFRLLSGADQFANLVQWLSMVFSLIGVSALAGSLGARRKGQLAATAFAASIPMGVLQATSTQNDYVSALWLVILAVFVVEACKHEVGPAEVLSIAAALGLGLLTKGTFYPYVIPLGAWLGLHWLRQRKWLQLLKRGCLILIISILLNLGYWMRNTVTFGGPLGPQSWISSMTSKSLGPGQVAEHLVENIAQNFAPPDDANTNRMLAVIRSTFQAVDPTVQNFQLIWAWNHEDLAGNPLHMLLVPAAMLALLLLVVFGRVKDFAVLWYSLTVLASFLTFTLVVHSDLYGVRYQLPFFVSWAPVFGVVVSKLGERRLAPIAGFLFLLAALPWVFFNRSRPIIALEKQPSGLAIRPRSIMGYTQIDSVLVADPATILFANWTYLQKPYTQMTDLIRSTGCKSVGIRIDSHDTEYEFWWLLGAPQNGTRIEDIADIEALTRYADPSFKPCAIICTICGDRTRLHGLTLSGIFAEAKLFLGNTYDPDKDK
jgi:hypothetical protein